MIRKTTGTPFTNEEEILSKKTVTIKLELDGREYTEKYECDELALFTARGEICSGTLKCTGRLLHDTIYKLLSEQREISQMAIEKLIEDETK